MWPLTKRPIDPEEQRLREAHERNKRKAALEKAARIAACPHNETIESYFDGSIYCVDCKAGAK